MPISSSQSVFFFGWHLAEDGIVAELGRCPGILACQAIPNLL